MSARKKRLREEYARFLLALPDQSIAFESLLPRRARLCSAGIPMHVILCGIDRGAIFFADDDYRHFVAKLSEVGAAESVSVHAYVLMTNHYLCEASHYMSTC